MTFKKCDDGDWMIRYTLRCADGHIFESWFRDSTAFDRLKAAGQVACTICGCTGIEKSLMAPAVSGTKNVPQAGQEAPLSMPATPAEAMLKGLREHLRKNSDYVGGEFASEARRIHQGDAEERSIWGEATLDDARSLSEDGIKVAPLPWISRQDD